MSEHNSVNNFLHSLYTIAGNFFGVVGMAGGAMALWGLIDGEDKTLSLGFFAVSGSICWAGIFFHMKAKKYMTSCPKCRKQTQITS